MYIGLGASADFCVIGPNQNHTSPKTEVLRLLSLFFLSIHPISNRPRIYQPTPTKMGLLRIACGVLCFVILVKAQSDNLYPSNANSGSSLTVFSKFYKHCENSEDLFRCIKQQALKLVNRAMNLQTIKLVDGVSLSRREPYANSKAANEVQSESEMRNLSSDEIDESLLNGASKLIQTFQLQFNLPKVFEFGKNEVHDMTEEGRKKKKKYLGPFLAAMAIKAGILKIAYHSIAIVAGKALSEY